MKSTVPLLATAATLAVPTFAWAKPVTIEAKLRPYGGDGAYIVVYVTDKTGAYKRTLWMSGWRQRYYRHLSDWYRGSGGREKDYDGITGASVGTGKTLKVDADLADTLIDAGFEVRVDTAVENLRDFPSDVVAPLTTAGAGTPVRGRGYIESFTYRLR